eukprot:TRINITY_DN2368_c0_g1_i1.p1 TRINITY_DN2368_c0_g1~~TRINITY_DN2368_c0_g1_i1.p1  ORF type:complete len:101 (-),score=33.77 TRINITY_DN2368_c0_g1_i1:81-383(-)
MLDKRYPTGVCVYSSSASSSLSAFGFLWRPVPLFETAPPPTASTSTALKRPFSSFWTSYWTCLLYTSDAADDLLCVDLGGRRIIKKKKKKHVVMMRIRVI